MVHVPYLLSALAAGVQLVTDTQAEKHWTQSASVTCGSGIRPRDTLPGRWEIINGSLWSAPSAASWGPDRLDVFGLGPGNELVHRSGDGCVWSEWEDLGNQLTTDPKAVGWRGSRLDVFARGVDGSLQARKYEENAWGAWYSLGGGPLRSAPAPVVIAPNLLMVLASNQNGELTFILQNANDPDPVTSWGPWQALSSFPRVFQGLNPVAVSRGGVAIDVFYLQDDDAALVHTYFSAGSWQSENLGGPFLADPAAVSLGPESIFVFGLAGDQSVHYRAWDGTSWSNWQVLPGAQAIYGPTVVSDRANTFDIYIIDLEGVLRHKQWANGVWTSERWELIDGPTFIHSPGIISWGSNNIDIFGIDYKHSVWHNW
ncbi:hypothetical protein QBC44DRAFT_352817 [Cladorrhinum sp. PSN332]|nr:hypothetical protein QBC44DRAFT_352817 [Cladorrhinum sp. PSN332]